MNTNRSEPIGIAGAGRLAQSLGRLLLERGEPVAFIASRIAEHAARGAEFIGVGVQATTYDALPGQAARLLVAVPDDALESVIATLAATASGGGVALHTSGVSDLEKFASLMDAGFSCGTLHPLQTISDPVQGCGALPGAAFAISGNANAVEWAHSIAEILGGRAVVIPADCRPVYHVAAVMASNYSMALLDAASELMALAANSSREDALRMLAPLARTAMENGLAQGPVAALTGPIQRGDVSTVALHIRALQSAPARVRALYAAAGLQTVDLARRGGLPEDVAGSLERLLERQPA